MLDTKISPITDLTGKTLLTDSEGKKLSIFVFDIPETENIELSSEISDHYTENNSFISDHEIRKPIQINLSGLIGELTFKEKDGLESVLQDMDNRLETVDAYLGDFTPGAIQDIQRTVNYAETGIAAANSFIDRGQNVIGFFDGESVEETAQQKAFNNLYLLWKTSVLLDVQTPWKLFKNMRIINIGISQNQDTEEITDINITLKELRFASLQTTDFSKDINAPRVDVQVAPTEDIGKIKGVSNNTLLFDIIEGIKG